MPVIIKAPNKSKAYELLSKCEQDFSDFLTISDENGQYVRMLLGTTLSDCIAELEQEPQTIKGDWCFLFTGQGVQTPNMMSELYNQDKIYKKNIDLCCDIFHDLFNESIYNVLKSSDATIHQTKWTQPALFIVEFAMAMSWIERGLEPKCVLGHSVGEYPAAVISGVMSLETGIELIGHRGRLMQSINQPGAMAAVMADLESSKKLIADNEIKIDIAGINSSKQTVVSGDKAEISRLTDIAKSQRLKVRELQVSHAFHSSHMDSILPEFRQLADKHDYKITTDCLLISNVTGKILSEAPNGSYWAKHIRSPVNFVEGVINARRIVSNFLEVGPHPVLCAMGTKTIEEKSNWFASYSNNKTINSYRDTLAKLINANVLKNI